MTDNTPDPRRPRQGRELAILVVLFTLALLPRLIAIDWGLPGQALKYGMYVPDEVIETIVSLALGEGRLQIGIVRNQPFFYFLLLAYYAGYFPIAVLAGQIDNWPEFMAWYKFDLSHFILVGRLMIAFSGAGTVVLVYLAGRKLADWRTGLAGALLLAVSVGHVFYSKVLRLDSLMPFLVACSYLLMLAILPGKLQRLRPYVLCGLAVAAAAMTKITGFALLVPLFMLPFIGPTRQGRLPLRRPHFSRQYVFAVVVVAATYLALAGPTYLFEAGAAGSNETLNLGRAVLGDVSRRLETAESYRNLGGFSTFDRSLPFHLTRSLPQLLGWPTYLLAILGLCQLTWLRRGNPETIILIATILAFLLPIGYLQRAAERDMLPLLPLLSLCAGFGLVTTSNWIGARLPGDARLSRPVVSAGAAALVILLPALEVARHTRLLLAEDTRVTAARWIEQNLPEGAHIALEPFGPAILDGEPAGGSIKLSQEYAAEDRPTYEIYELQEWLTNSTDVFDADRLDAFLAEKQVEYIVLSSGYYYRFYNPAMDHHFPDHARQGRQFHDQLVARLRPMEVFLPDWQSAPGPIIQVFEVEIPSDQTSGNGQPFEPYPWSGSDVSAIGFEEALRP